MGSRRRTEQPPHTVKYLHLGFTLLAASSTTSTTFMSRAATPHAFIV